MEFIKFNNIEIKLNLRDDADISVMREVFKLREYKSAEEIICAAADPILDVGAHAGFFTLYCRALNNKVKIFALEPEQNNLSALADHVKLNKLSNIKIISGALANSTGKRELFVAPDNHNHFLSSKGNVLVDCWSLADLCAVNKIKVLSLLKLDIEGGEFEIFESMTAAEFLLFKSVILEYHNYNGRDCAELENYLRENGFGVQIFPSKFDKHMGFIFAQNKRLKK